MKKTKIFALVLTLVLLVTQFAMLGTVPASATGGIDDIPDYPDYAVVELSREGRKNTWGTNYNNTGDRLYVATASTVDLSDVDQIEFDIYIDDLAAFQSAWYPKNPRFYVSSGDSRGSDRSAYAYYSQITQSGWNHVVFDKTNTTSSSSADFSSIKWVGLNDWSGSTSANPVGSTEVRFANVCGTMKEINRVPAYPDHAVVELSREGKKNTWGTNYNNTGDRLYVATASVVDLSAVDRIEFDIYIEDLAAFQSAWYPKNPRFYVSSGATRGDNRSAYAYYSQITQSGWNHVVFDKTNTTSSNSADFSSIKWVGLNDWSGSTSANPVGSTQVRFANVCGTMNEINRIPDWPSYEHIEILKSNTANWWGSSANNGNHLVTGLPDTDMRDTEQVEFDVFIDNYSGFVSQTAGGEIRFRFGSAGDNYIDVNVKSKITHEGWNHVTAVWVSSSVDANTDRYSLTGDPVLSAIRWVKLYSSVGINGDIVGKTRMANVCFTKKPINRIPAWPSYEHIEILKSNTANWWGGANSSNHLVTGLTETDISATEQVEFDVYIDNYDGFVSQTASGNVLFRFGSQGDNYIDVNVKSKITHQGWNHVAAVWLPGSADSNTDRASVTGSPVLTAIRWVKLYSTVAIAWDACGRTRIANVCFTKKATFKTKSLVLADRIGLNFFMDLSRLSAEQKNGSYMTFAVTNKTNPLQDEYDSTDVNASGYNCFTCQLSSMEMAETVTPTFHYGTGETVTGPGFSVKDYIDYVAEHPATFPGKLQALVKALGDYGHYAQVYLGGRNGWTSGTDYTAIGKYRAEDYDSSDYSVYLSALSSTALRKSIDGTAVTGVSYSLNFDSNTYVNVELATTDSLIASATVDGKTLYLSSSGKVRTQGLPILKLGTPIAITGRGSANATTFTVDLSGLSYICAILNSGTSAAAKNAVSALYDYYKVARTYMGV